MSYFDFLVIGSGIAGLTYALEVAKWGSVAVICKGDAQDTATSWAQGGIAAVSGDDDNAALHINDTIEAGAGLCNREVVELVVQEGPARVRQLIEWGACFDRSSREGGYHLHREGGHSRRRIYHAADRTGFEIQRTLLSNIAKHRQIRLFPFHFAIDLITTHKLGLALNDMNRTLGAYVYTPTGGVEVFLADKILVATGGAGRVYLYTSNPDHCTGDGVAMCYRAGARVANMEFFQFHPTCLYHSEARTYLLTEALRGEGARLKRINGESFMHKYHPAGELAPRDIVARAIDYEMKEHGEQYVLLDISHSDADMIRQHFPGVFQQCLRYGYDMTREGVPVVPAAHYCCGGVLTDIDGRSDLESLYVVGEAACTGLHGANRLASNSLLEGLVFGARAAQHSIKNLRKEGGPVDVPDWDSSGAVNSDEAVVITQNWDEIRRFMWNYVGIVRSSKRLERALHRCRLIEEEITEYYWNFLVTADLLELRNLNLVAQLAIQSALLRQESRGLHYTIDFPDKLEAEGQDTILQAVE